MTVVFVFSIAAFFLSVFSFFFFSRYLRRRTGPERILAEFREEIDGMITELNAATVRDETLVEERVRSLRALLEETDRRIATWARELERRDTQAEVIDEYSRSQGGREGNAAPGYAELGNRLKSPFSGGGPDAVYLSPELFRPQEKEPGVSGESVPPAPAEPAPRQPAAPRIQRGERQIAPKPKPFTEQAAELHRAGLSSSLIASRLGATVTEVELAVALAERGAGKDLSLSGPSDEG